MDSKKRDGIFRIAGTAGLVLLLTLFVFSKNGSMKSNDSVEKKDHDHVNPAEHGDIKGKHLEKEDKKLVPSGELVKGKRIITYEAFKFAFSPDPLIVRSGETVVLKLKSRDVEHGIMIPEIDFNSSMPVNKVTEVSFKAPVKPGKYPIFCSTYCGTDHGNMRGTLLVLPKE